MVASPISGNPAKAIANHRKRLVRHIGNNFQAIEKILMNECYHTPKVIRAHAMLILACNEVVDSLNIDFAATNPAGDSSGESQLSPEGAFFVVPK